MEQDVLDEINLRSECLMEMYQIVEQSSADKPDEAQVDQLLANFKTKSNDLRTQMKNKFKEMRAILNVQEQTTDAILKKNFTYVENELKSLKSLDYSMFTEADKWLKNAKVKLDNFQANNENPNYIAFDMLEKKNGQQDDIMNNDNLDDDLLNDDAGAASRNFDIINHGEKIAEQLGKVKTINPNLLASQLQELSLTFDDSTIQNLHNVSKCIAIEGVEISAEEMDALKEAANAAQAVQVEEPKIQQ